MRINFRQGIVTYPNNGSPSFSQAFLQKVGANVNLLVSAGSRVDIAFAHGLSNYLFTETISTTSAWQSIPASTDTWLYWDLDTTTGERTFGFTLVPPTSGSTFPPSPVNNQHFFKLLDISVGPTPLPTDNKMYVFSVASHQWIVHIRVFAAKVNNSTFTALGSGFLQAPFAGTQVGLTSTSSTFATGYVLIDDTGKGVRRLDGRFFTTEDEMFINGSPINTIRLEATVLNATANTNLPAFQVVKWIDFNVIDVATYFDLQTSAIGIVEEVIAGSATGTVITQGTVTNPAWNWPTVGALLWIDNVGTFVQSNPHLTDITTYPIDKAPIARVIAPTTIIFGEGAGGNGASVSLATATVYGVSRLSVAPVVPNDPIAVGDNDPRLTSSGTAPLNEIVFGTGTGTTSDPNFTWDLVLGVLKIGSLLTPGTITGANGSSSDGTPLIVKAGDGNGTNHAGGVLSLKAGAPTGTGQAGTVVISSIGGYTVQRSGQFSVAGDAQANMYVLRASTTNAVLTEMFLDGPAGTRRMIVPTDASWHFECRVVARRTDVDNDSAGYRLVGVIHNNGGTVSVVGGVTSYTDAEASASWDVTVDADNVNKALRVQVTGEGAKSINWVAFVQTVEVTG